jgi:hypothetical protein
MTRTNANWPRLLVSLALLSGAASAWAFYDPSAGRWINRDPNGEREGRNLYGFVLNDAVAYVDSFGLDLFRPISLPALPLPPLIPLPPLPPGQNLPPPCAPYPECLSHNKPDCFDRCLQKSGWSYGWALVGIGTVGGGTIPTPIPKPLGGKPSIWTTFPSLVELGGESIGLNLGNALRRCSDRVNPFMTCVQVGGLSYCTFLPLTCAAMCSVDPAGF